MAYNKNYGITNNPEDGLIWDLRQIYANKIVGKILEYITMARLNNDYPSLFKLLKRDLATEINHKLDDQEKQELKEVIDTTKRIIRENEAAYTKQDASNISYEKLEEALCHLEKHLKELMELHNMFGKKEEDIGL